MRALTWFLSLAAVTTSLAADPIALWPHGAPGTNTNLSPELNTTKPSDRPVGGKPVIRLGNVSTPTLTVYSPPAGKNTGAAVVVCPGGAYRILAYDLEGTEICEWLNSLGITGVLLKYRVPSPPHEKPYEAPLQDAQRALRLVRAHAEEWHIATNRIGILGFSAGGHLAATASCRFDNNSYEAVDAADALSCRPDFAVLVYPAYLTLKDHRDQVSPELTVTAHTPPTFIVQTEDDVVPVEGSLHYYLALKDAKVPAEMHLFPKGGHGYGLRPSENSVCHWPQLAEQWLRSCDLLHGAH